MDGPTIRLWLRVGPGASKPGVVGRYGDAWKVRVSAAPENGKANEAVLDLLARTLGLSLRDLEIVTGHASRDKVVSLRGLSRRDVDQRLASVADGAR